MGGLAHAQTIFRMQRGKIVWSTACPIFVPCGLNIGDTTSIKMYCEVTQSLKLRKSSKEMACCKDILLGASKHQETKIHKTWSLCQPQIALGQSYQRLKASELHTASFQAQKHTHLPFTEVLAFYRRSFSGPSLIAVRCSTWCHSCEAIWLERHECGAWNKNWIGSWPDYFSPSCVKGCLAWGWKEWVNDVECLWVCPNRIQSPQRNPH